MRPGAGIDLFKTSAQTEDITNGLTVYPEDLLKSPPSVSEAVFEFKSGTTTLAPPSRSAGTNVARDEAQRSLGRFASLVDRQNLTPAFVAIALLLAMGWGAMHALGPGHGKTVVAAYLVGERGNGRHAIYLGMIVTATHTISVFTLGLIALFAADIFDADDVYYWLSLASGVLVLVLGGMLLQSRVRTLLRGRRYVKHTLSSHEHAHDGHTHAAHEHGHSHSHDVEARRAFLQGNSMLVAPPTAHAQDGHRHDTDDGHDHHHGHSHVPTAPGWKGIVALGISGGLVPCPTALVVMLGAIAIDRAVYGLVLRDGLQLRACRRADGDRAAAGLWTALPGPPGRQPDLPEVRLGATVHHGVAGAQCAGDSCARRNAYRPGDALVEMVKGQAYVRANVL